MNRKQAIKKMILTFMSVMSFKLFSDEKEKSSKLSHENKISQTKFEENEIKNPVNLCNEDGSLNKNSIGWSRFPLQSANLKGNWLRKKKWNYWCVSNQNAMFSVTISDLDYAGMIFAYYLDFKENTLIEDSIIVPFSTKTQMGQKVFDDAVYHSDKCLVKMESKDKTTKLSVNWKNFQGSELISEIKISYPKDHETLNVLVPWDDNRFQFTSKHHSLPSEGFFSHKGKKIVFDQKDTYGCLDFGRGIWPYKISWNWGGTSGVSSNATIGINLGAKWTDGTGISENSVCINGKLEKIKEPVTFSYDKKNYKNLWKIQSTITDSIDLNFTPFYERVAKSDFLIIDSEVHQMFGHYNGKIRVGNKIYKIKDFIGWAEDHSAKW